MGEENLEELVQKYFLDGLHLIVRSFLHYEVMCSPWLHFFHLKPPHIHVLLQNVYTQLVLVEDSQLLVLKQYCFQHVERHSSDQRL